MNEKTEIKTPYITAYDENDNIGTYKSLSKVKIYIPKSGIKFPKDSDYKKGYFYRYFCRQSNNKDADVKEIDEKEYNKLRDNFLYRPLKIKWKLIGDAETAAKINMKIISVSETILPGIKDLLSRDPLQFWRNLPDVITQFDVTNKLPKREIKKKHFNVDIVAVVAFDERGFVYILTQDLDIIYTEDSVGLLVQP